MTDLSDFQRLIHEPVVAKLRARIAELEADRKPAPTVSLAPLERIALTVAKAQLARGDEVTPNIAAVCVMTLARIEDEA